LLLEERKKRNKHLTSALQLFPFPLSLNKKKKKEKLNTFLFLLQPLHRPCREVDISHCLHEGTERYFLWNLFRNKDFNKSSFVFFSSSDGDNGVEDAIEDEEFLSGNNIFSNSSFVISFFPLIVSLSRLLNWLFSSGILWKK
jgi:hypothetical protein